MTIKDTGNCIHFVEQDNPSAIAEGIAEWVRNKSLDQCQCSISSSTDVEATGNGNA
ncbi:MAG: hypothetical protein JSV13_04955 [Nitrospiraceae bacterium]|nr:MAG: hypothetical protein JSV13_04955 [Nitrospiraceae bacterium]